MNMLDRKAAFVKVLAANLTHDIQADVIRFWEEKYATKPQFGISAFLDELYGRYQVAIKKGQLFKELSRAIMTVGGSGNSAATAANSGADSTTIAGADLELFRQLMTEFLQRAAPADRQKITKAQFEGSQQLKFDADTNACKQVLGWLQRGGNMPAGQLDLALLKKLFNFGYIEACQLYGPVRADQMLTGALQAAGSLHLGGTHSPAQFV